MMSRQNFLIITRSIIKLSLLILHVVTMHKQMKNGQVIVCNDSKNIFCKQSEVNDISHTICNHSFAATVMGVVKNKYRASLIA